MTREQHFIEYIVHTYDISLKPEEVLSWNNIVIQLPLSVTLSIVEQLIKRYTVEPFWSTRGLVLANTAIPIIYHLRQRDNIAFTINDIQTQIRDLKSLIALLNSGAPRKLVKHLHMYLEYLPGFSATQQMTAITQHGYVYAIIQKNLPILEQIEKDFICFYEENYLSSAVEKTSSSNKEKVHKI